MPAPGVHLFCMFRSWISRLDLLARAEQMRLLHSRWLTQALQRGVRPPRIPVRRVSARGEGGWTALMATPEGQAWAAEFWEQTLDHPDAQ